MRLGTHEDVFSILAKNPRLGALLETLGDALK
jgi:hypothetical protein